mmetsp:Transcript_13665/g.43771  ORF Transcript_13665/g.43771 Transcript_13665/m.43771 type:complete len:242 (-) Transcript_13665:573-1298(-)
MPTPVEGIKRLSELKQVDQVHLAWFGSQNGTARLGSQNRTVQLGSQNRPGGGRLGLAIRSRGVPTYVEERSCRGGSKCGAEGLEVLDARTHALQPQDERHPPPRQPAAHVAKERPEGVVHRRPGVRGGQSPRAQAEGEGGAPLRRQVSAGGGGAAGQGDARVQKVGVLLCPCSQDGVGEDHGVGLAPAYMLASSGRRVEQVRCASEGRLRAEPYIGIAECAGGHPNLRRHSQLPPPPGVHR